jgi:hypothetical protein
MVSKIFPPLITLYLPEAVHLTLKWASQLANLDGALSVYLLGTIPERVTLVAVIPLRVNRQCLFPMDLGPTGFKEILVGSMF